MTDVDPIVEFIGMVKRDVMNAETADELLAIAVVIVWTLGAPQDTP